MALVTVDLLGTTVPNSSTSSLDYTLGFVFTPAMAVTILGIGYYRYPGNVAGSRIALLYDYNTQALLASKTFSGDNTDNAWNYQNFDTPYSASASTPYLAAIFYPDNETRGGDANNWSDPYSLLSNPVHVTTGSAGRYGTANLGVPSFPTTVIGSWYGVNMRYQFDDSTLPQMSKIGRGYPAQYGATSICLGGASKNLTVSARKELVEGNPSPPCLALDIPSSYRFRWGVKAGTRTFTTSVKQVSNVTGKRPRVIIRANPDIGVNSDIVTDAGAGTGWVTVGPISVSPSSDGVLFVEFWNMDTDTLNSPAYFGRITRT